MISKNLRRWKLPIDCLSRFRMHPSVKERSHRRDTMLCKISKLERMDACWQIEEHHSKFGEPGQRRWPVLEAPKCWNQSWLKAWSKSRYKAKRCWSEITKSHLRTCCCRQDIGKAILKGVGAWKAWFLAWRLSQRRQGWTLSSTNLCELSLNPSRIPSAMVQACNKTSPAWGRCQRKSCWTPRTSQQRRKSEAWSTGLCNERLHTSIYLIIFIEHYSNLK